MSVQYFRFSFVFGGPFSPIGFLCAMIDDQMSIRVAFDPNQGGIVLCLGMLVVLSAFLSAI